MSSKTDKFILRFSSDFDDRGLNTENADGKYRLFEIDGVLGETLLSSKEKVYIKGERTDEAVMCTETSTYEIRKKESSNTVLLIPETFENGSVRTSTVKRANAPVPGEVDACDKNGEVTIYGGMPNIYTMRKISPRYDQLQKLLMLSVYSGKVEGNTDTGRGNKRIKLNTGEANVTTSSSVLAYTFKELLSRVQCSEKELVDGLVKFDAFELNERWRIMGEDYLMRLSDTILSTIISEGMDICTLKCSDIVSKINTTSKDHNAHEPEAIIHVLKLYAKPYAVKGIESSPTTLSDTAPGVESVSAVPVVVKPINGVLADIQGTVELDLLKVSIFRAKQLLSQPSLVQGETYKRWKLSDFLDTWSEQMFGMTKDNGVSVNKYVSLDRCRDIALIDSTGPDKIIKRFFASDLPTGTKERFEMLFKTRSKWLEDDLKPFVEQLVSTGNSLSSLLMKNTRSKIIKVSDPKTGKTNTMREYSSR